MKVPGHLVNVVVEA